MEQKVMEGIINREEMHIIENYDRDPRYYEGLHARVLPKIGSLISSLMKLVSLKAVVRLLLILT